jgi:hypothetical protein
MTSNSVSTRRQRPPRPILVPLPPQTSDSIVCIAQMTPHRGADTDYEPIRSLALCRKIAKIAAQLPGVIYVEESRSQMHAVMETPTAHGDAWKYLARAILAQIDVELDGWTDVNPLEWYQAFFTCERLAREALNGRHQCEQSYEGFCICDLRGNEKPETGVNRFGSRGGMFGPGRLV